MLVLVDKNNTPIKFPFHESSLRKMYPNVSFPAQMSIELLETYGVFQVSLGKKPSYDSFTQELKQRVENKNGKWVVTYDVVYKREQVIHNAAQQRVKQELLDTQDLVLSYLEKGLPVPENLSNYRDSLRKLEKQDGYPFKIAWPTFKSCDIVQSNNLGFCDAAY